MFFGQDNRPAGILLCTLFAILVAALVEAKVRKVNSTTACRYTMWCFFALSALSISICLPMPVLQLSTSRCYALLTMLVLQAYCLVADLDLNTTCTCLHLLASVQLLLLPGTWSRLSELGRNHANLALFLIIEAFFVWTILGFLWASLIVESGGDKKRGSIKKGSDLSTSNANATLQPNIVPDNASKKSGSLEQGEVNFVVTTSAVNFVLLAVLQFY
ncbi:hypothetical protein FA10DRAFT_269836 [Acaromyces ingoldii]|uniref:Chitin synthase export chaperone n=1 Tax=Acaromyces ingoldii TaxID=215250 RepID=A0A316YDI3_9BASI|nr:hypothetical protein FA10DRAFT_269836 [Acaromyces ingoldii]PWN87262.1 hypothetical protein FA10DRAFT_269836 [Acaromyces ingoldii]